MRVLGCYGKGEGKLYGPKGVTVDSIGMVYVSEERNHRISVFSSDGQFIHCFDGGNSIKTPRGLAVDASGVVYVCDKDANSIEFF